MKGSVIQNGTTYLIDRVLQKLNISNKHTVSEATSLDKYMFISEMVVIQL